MAHGLKSGKGKVRLKERNSFRNLDHSAGVAGKLLPVGSESPGLIIPVAARVTSFNDTLSHYVTSSSRQEVMS